MELQAAMSDLDKQKMRFTAMCSSSGCQKDSHHVEHHFHKVSSRMFSISLCLPSKAKIYCFS